MLNVTEIKYDWIIGQLCPETRALFNEASLYPVCPYPLSTPALNTTDWNQWKLENMYLYRIHLNNLGTVLLTPNIGWAHM